MPEAVEVESAKALEALAEARTEGVSATPAPQESPAEAALEYLATPADGERARRTSIRLNGAARTSASDASLSDKEARAPSVASQGRLLRKALALLLMVMGVVLAGLSVVTIILLWTRETSPTSDAADSLGRLGPPLVMLSCPLALLLLTGAWLLRLDGSRRGTEKRPGGHPGAL
jgi:uncharacterized membrane protein YdbT with pleckstrin-like domain